MTRRHPSGADLRLAEHRSVEAAEAITRVSDGVDPRIGSAMSAIVVLEDVAANA